MKPYRVLIADDHPLARGAVRALLEDEVDFEIVGEASDGRQALEACSSLSPDVILMDIHMPELDGLEAARLVRQRYPAVKVVILSVSDAVRDLFTALQFGAQGFLLKSMDPGDWLVYLRALLEEDADVPRQMADKLFQRFKAGPDAVQELRSSDVQVESLTARELEIVALVAAGATNRVIAERLSISEHTVKNHMKHVLDKLGLDNRVQLAAYAIRNALTKDQN